MDSPPNRGLASLIHRISSFDDEASLSIAVQECSGGNTVELTVCYGKSMKIPHVWMGKSSKSSINDPFVHRKK